MINISLLVGLFTRKTINMAAGVIVYPTTLFVVPVLQLNSGD